MAPHSSTLAWKIPWTEEPGRRQSMGSLRVGHDWATSLSLFTFMLWRRKWQPTPVFLPGESQGRGVWWAAVYGVAQSRTRLKWLSSSSSSLILSRSLPSFMPSLFNKLAEWEGWTRSRAFVFFSKNPHCQFCSSQCSGCVSTFCLGFLVDLWSELEIETDILS